MALPTRMYLEELARMRQRVNEIFEQALMPSVMESEEVGAPGTWIPAVDVVETEGAYLLFAEVPGVARENLQLEVRGRRLEISGRRAAGPERSFLRLERSYGPFRRSFELEGPVDADGVSAKLERGVLAITVPKQGGERSQTISIEGGEGS